MELTHYKYVLKEIEIKEVINRKVKKMLTINIGVKDLTNNIILPHPITDFIRTKYEYIGNSSNTQIKAARIVCGFLNFLLEKVNSGSEDYLPLKKGIGELKIIHGSNYLTYLTMNGRTFKGVTENEHFLKVFYNYLFELGLINPEMPITTFIGKNDEIKIESPFRNAKFNTRFPNKDTENKKKPKLKNFGENKYSMVEEFLLVAKHVAPQIAFGLGLQFYGGLRRGEVVNIQRSNLKIDYRESISIEIRDNRRTLFNHLKDTTKENPKRLNYLQLEMAIQDVLVTDLLWDLYDSHMKDWYNRYERGEVKNNMALFINKDGTAISGTLWDKLFREVKDEYIEMLKSTPGRNDDYKLLNEGSFGSHIGRGNFTDFLFDMGLSVVQIAISRGDTNWDSAKAYVDKKMSSIAIKEAFKQIQSTPKEQFGRIEKEIIENKWKRGGFSGKR